MKSTNMGMKDNIKYTGIATAGGALLGGIANAALKGNRLRKINELGSANHHTYIRSSMNLHSSHSPAQKVMYEKMLKAKKAGNTKEAAQYYAKLRNSYSEKQRGHDNDAANSYHAREKNRNDWRRVKSKSRAKRFAEGALLGAVGTLGTIGVAAATAESPKNKKK